MLGGLAFFGVGLFGGWLLVGFVFVFRLLLPGVVGVGLVGIALDCLVGFFGWLGFWGFSVWIVGSGLPFWWVGVGGFVGEFDPGSGRTLAACLTHASRTGRSSLLGLFSGERVSNT